MLISFLVLIIIVGMTGATQATEIRVPIFEAASLKFGDPTDGPTWESKDEGRIVRRSLKLPEFSGPVKITARLKLESAGDPWDRFGTVYLVSPEGSANVELLKFMTGFGTGLPYKRDDIPDHSTVEKWAEYSLWEADLTHLVNFLSGQVTIEAIIDTWVNPGWLMDFELVFEPVEEVVTPDWVVSVFNNTGEYWTKEMFASSAASFEVEIPAGLESVQMFYLTSGHGGRSSGDEFNKKDHVIHIDGAEVLRFVPWREDGPLFRPFSPTSAKWTGDVWSSDLSRSNWIPGDQVKPMVFELGNYLSAGQHTIRLEVENMAESTPDNLNYWNTSIVLVGYKQNPAKPKELAPYLQAPNPTGMSVSWVHDADFSSVVKYGTTKALGQKATGSTETIAGELIWHTVHLKDLNPSNTYYYQVWSGLSSSPVHQFTTPPATGSTEPLIVGIVGEASVAEDMEAVLLALKTTANDQEQDLNLIMHTGNVVHDGFKVDQYVTQLLEPFAKVSTQVPVHIVPGELEQESLYLYQFAHNDAFDDYFATSDYADTHGRLGEETYQFRLGRTMFFVFNTNKLGMEGLSWLEKVVAQADKDANVDNLLVLTHRRLEHLSSFVKNRITTILGNTKKPKLLIHGDGAGYEKGHNNLDYLALGKGEPNFLLLRVEPEQRRVMIQAYGVNTRTGQVLPLEESSYLW